MSGKETVPFRRAGTPADVVALPFAVTLHGRVVLCLATVAALLLSFAPFKQFYLAWIGLVPWLVMIAHARSKKAVFFLLANGDSVFFCEHVVDCVCDASRGDGIDALYGDLVCVCGVGAARGGAFKG